MNKENFGLSAVICVCNEEKQLAECLAGLSFADEIVVVLDKCTDKSHEIAARYTNILIEGDWSIEGERRNVAIENCSGEWILEIDADERVPLGLASEIQTIVKTSAFDWHAIPVANYIGTKLVRYGWGASFGKNQYPGLFRKGSKVWGLQRVHPAIEFIGTEGPILKNSIDHFVDRNISDMIKRLDSYSTARAKDIRENGDGGSFVRNVRRIFTRFWKCYVSRKGYREGSYGFLIAILASLYPLLSYLKATLEEH